MMDVYNLTSIATTILRQMIITPINDSITFIVASYNDSELIRSTIESIQKNMYSQDRLIIVDGASTDGTLTILDELARTTNQISFISEPDTGIYDAWNKALTTLSTDWASFIGCGDKLLENFRVNIDDVLKKNSTSNFIHFNGSFYKISNSSQKSITTRTVGKPLEKKHFKNRMRICHVGALHHKSLFKPGHFSTEYVSVSDYLFLLERLTILKPFYINCILVHIESTGVSQNSLFPIKEEFKMKNNLNNYSKFNLYKKLMLTSARHYFFKLYDYISYLK